MLYSQCDDHSMLGGCFKNWYCKRADCSRNCANGAGSCFIHICEKCIICIIYVTQRTSNAGVDFYCCFFGAVDDARCSLTYKPVAELQPMRVPNGGSNYP